MKVISNLPDLVGLASLIGFTSIVILISLMSQGAIIYYYENVMKILAEDDVGRRLRGFLGVDVSSVKNGCEVLCSVRRYPKES